MPDVQLLDGDVYWLCGISIAMKPIQVTFDEALLERLDAHPAVRERGRSAVLREAAAAYLGSQGRRGHRHPLYRAGYRPADGLEAELEGWAEEGVWPED